MPCMTFSAVIVNFILDVKIIFTFAISGIYWRIHAICNNLYVRFSILSVYIRSSALFIIASIVSSDFSATAYPIEKLIIK